MLLKQKNYLRFNTSSKARVWNRFSKSSTSSYRPTHVLRNNKWKSIFTV